MGLLDSIRSTLTTSGPSSGTPIAGAYWCDDCSVRIPSEEPPDGTERTCPECDGEMRFERSPDSGGCAC